MMDGIPHTVFHGSRTGFEVLPGAEVTGPLHEPGSAGNEQEPPTVPWDYLWSWPLISKRPKHGFILSFSPEPFDVIAPISVRVAYDEGGVQASFEEADIATYGETEAFAIENLKSLILDMYEALAQEPDSRLGPGPRKQLEILRRLVRRQV